MRHHSVLLATGQHPAATSSQQNTALLYQWVAYYKSLTATSWSTQYLKMISKGFVHFKINSSPSAFYIIKHTCISWLVFKVSNYFKKLSKSANPNVCLCFLVMTSSPSESKHPACLDSRTALNLIFGMLSAQFKFNNNVKRWNWQSWFIYGRITAAAGLFSVNTEPVRPVSHF